MRSQKHLLVDQVERKMAPYYQMNPEEIPEKGWIFTLRSTLNITLDQLGRRMGITRQGVKRIESSEEKGGISLNLLRQVGEAMDMKLVYGFVPLDGSLGNLIDRKALELAKKIVLRTNQTMLLENQAISKKKLESAIKELAYQFKQELSKSLWD